METALSPIEFARGARRLYSDREAVVDGNLRFTYGEFLTRCDRWSAALQGLGVRQGDRVAYIAPNTHAHLEAYYAVPQIGAVLVPINFRPAPDEFQYIINHSGAKAVCVHADFIQAVDGLRNKLPEVEHFVALEGSGHGWIDYETVLGAHEPDFVEPEIGENDLLTINYTSGTTARGMAHVCLRQVEPTQIFRLIREEYITMFCAAPTVLIGIANAPEAIRAGAPRGVRLFTAGAPPAAATIEAIERDLGWVLTHVYGLTETSPLITICEPRPDHLDLPVVERAKIKARQGVDMLASGEVRVVDDDGRDVPRDGDTLGEIIVRGNVVMKGYYNDPEATAAAIRDGWFHSGDAAIVHPDGYVEIRDRFKDVIISGGENISSVEVEGCLLRHPAVREVAVVGMPHERWGESPHAFVVLRDGAQASADNLKLHVRENLAHFKTPQWVSFVVDLPKTATGEVQKFVLRGGQSAIARQ